MDEQRFDDFTRTLAGSSSRRTVLRRLLGGVLGGMGAGAGLQRGLAAQPQPNVGICHRDDAGVYHYIEVNGNAVPAHEAHGDAIAPDFATDPAHCGGCGVVCPTGYTCEAGACIEPPPVGPNGSLDESDSVRPSGCREGFRYDAYTFAHPGGPLSLAARGASSGGGTLEDPFLYLYAGAGVPSDTCAYVSYNDDGGCGRDAYLEVDLAAGTYTALVESYNNRLGTYTFERNTFAGHDVCP